jgi:hypothetical protein
MISCGEEKIREPLFGSTDAPNKLTNIQIENINGGAIITYDLPNQDDIEYVVSRIDLGDGIVKEELSSIYQNYTLIQGLPDTSDYKVTMTLRNSAGQESESENVVIKPKLPDFVTISKSLSVKPTFGGVDFIWLNAARTNVTMFFYAADTLGNLEVADIIPSSLDTGLFQLRDLAPVKNCFGIKVRDQWGNFSQMYLDSVTPLYEEKIDGKKWKMTKLANDNYEGSDLYKLSDEKTTGGGDRIKGTYDGASPMSFTFDMGQNVRVTRFVLFNRISNSWSFNGRALKEWELYGANELSENWDDWVDLTPGRVPQVFKPSGLPPGGGNNTEEDMESLKKGTSIPTDFENLGYYRYIRFKMISNWGNELGQVGFTELEIYGQIEGKEF